MNSAAIVFLSVTLSSGAAVGVHSLLQSSQDTSSSSSDAPDLSLAIRESRERLDRLERKLEEWSARPLEASAPVRTAVDEKLIANAVAAYFAKRGPGAAASVDSAAKRGKKRRGPKELLALVDAGELEIWKLGEHMRELSEDERKQIVQHFADIAKAKQYDADAQADYGNALIQKLLNAPIVEQAVLGQLADKQFDKALALDEQHWSARFSKAMSLSHWPAVMGKQPEAMKHFEILIQQQESKASQPQFTQSYVILGNLYSQQGRTEEARKVWQRGLDRFPNSAQLKERLK